MRQRRALYPGTFDVLTFGHLDLIQRSSRLFDHVTVAITHNEDKQPLFSDEERLEMLREVTGDLPNVTVTHFEGLTVDFATEIGADAIIRGLRAVSDFEYELQMALMNHKLNPNVETVFLAPAAQFSFVSSSLVREVFSLNGDVGELVPPIVEQKLREKVGRR